MSKVFVVFCEGQHDISFISRVLKAHGFSGYDRKIREFLKPLNKQFSSILESRKISDYKLGFNSEYKIPSVALNKGGDLVLFHNMGGDSKYGNIIELIKMYSLLKGDDDFTRGIGIDFRFIFTFDADELGIGGRVAEVNGNLNYDNPILHGSVIDSNGYELACYIFHNDENGGDLEDIIIGLVTETEGGILNSSRDFIDNNKLDLDRTKEFVCTDIERRHKAATKFKYKKSQISIAGQLQFSGMNNSVFISNTDFITYEQLTTNPHCVCIKSLFDYQ
ncbi:hypothetical protein [Shewanella vaxholmensis]|uniref:DUF3226 domain-containing protein n=1 Tax=Shewanella vaxholmensis TaxID=3063535 RepID=A0ABU9URE8_9GAMM